MRTIVWSPRYACEIGPHVFPTRKYGRVMEALRAGGDLENFEVREPEAVDRTLLERVHTPAYLDEFLALRPTARVLRSELPIDAPIRDAALFAAGGTLLAARHALADGAAMHVGGGFHHAMPDHAEGFCYLNDIAIAIRGLQSEGAITNAAVIDTDVHQGNGTARIFQGDPSVFTFSIHQENNYPVKEIGDLDIGLDDGVGDAEYLEQLAGALPQVFTRSQADIVLMVAGADPYREDLLGGLDLTRAGLQARDDLVVRECARRRIPIVGLLAGGYAANQDDTVAIHTATARAVLAWGAVD